MAPGHARFLEVQAALYQLVTWSRWSPVHVRFPALQAAFHWLLVIFPKEGGEDGLRLKRLTQIADKIPDNIFA